MWSWSVQPEYERGEAGAARGEVLGSSQGGAYKGVQGLT